MPFRSRRCWCRRARKPLAGVCQNCCRSVVAVPVARKPRAPGRRRGAVPRRGLRRRTRARSGRPFSSTSATADDEPCPTALEDVSPRRRGRGARRGPVAERAERDAYTDAVRAPRLDSHCLATVLTTIATKTALRWCSGASWRRAYSSPRSLIWLMRTSIRINGGCYCSPQAKCKLDLHLTDQADRSISHVDAHQRASTDEGVGVAKFTSRDRSPAGVSQSTVSYVRRQPPDLDATRTRVLEAPRRSPISRMRGRALATTRTRAIGLMVVPVPARARTVCPTPERRPSSRRSRAGAQHDHDVLLVSGRRGSVRVGPGVLPGVRCATRSC